MDNFEIEKNSSTNIETQGGAYVDGPVNVSGDFVGRDQHTYKIAVFLQQSSKATNSSYREKTCLATKLILSSNFEIALETLDTLASDQREDPLVCTLRALAYIRGRHPVRLRSRELQSIEADLLLSMKHDVTRLIASMVLRIILQDKYLINGRSASFSFEEISQVLDDHSETLSTTGRKLVATISASSEAKTILRLGKEL